MANEKHLKILKQGVEVWNKWREENHDVRPNFNKANLRKVNLDRANLSKADLTGADLIGANLFKVDLSEADLNMAKLREAYLYGAKLIGANLSQAYLLKADLSEADLSKANLSKANLKWSRLGYTDLSNADLSQADLSGAALVGTNLTKADLTGCSIFGISAWELNLEGTKQADLVISSADQSVITVDNLEVAQFTYLLINNEKLRDVIDTITSKAVLILGRFTPERKAVLDAIREELRRLNYVPMMFDFERPTDRDFTETIMTLAGMCRFIIADITNPSSSPLELQTTVPNFRIPFVPIIQEGERPFAMFKDLYGKFDWVLVPLAYPNKEKLVEKLKEAVIEPALEKSRELTIKKAEEMPIRSL